MRPTRDELEAAHATLHKLYMDLEDEGIPYDHPIPQALDTTGAFIKATLKHDSTDSALGEVQV